MDFQDFQPDERIAEAEVDLKLRERRLRQALVALFFLATALLIYVWIASTAGERACRSWLEEDEPRLKAVTIEMARYWNKAPVTCDDEETIRYFESCLDTALHSEDFSTHGSYFNDCTVVLSFDNGAEYRSPGPCEITADGIQLAFPVELDRPTRYAFREPMPEGWKRVLNTLLGPGTVD